MKNRGLLNRAIISPLGTHKDPSHTSLPNQQISRITADPNRTETVAPDQEPLQPNRPSQEPRPSLRATASAVPIGKSKRYTLILKLDQALHHRLEAWLEHLGPSARSATKRAMLLAFRSHLATIVHDKAIPAAAPVDPVPYRIDIRLPDPLARQLVATARQTAFEPEATLLARSLAPYFGDFVRRALAPD